MNIPENDESVTQLLMRYEKEIREWHTEQVYKAIRQEEKEHLLVRLAEGLDFGPVEEACAGYRQYKGKRGQEARYSIGQLAKTLLVRYLYGWSLRQSEAEVRGNLLLRWFCGYGLSEPVADHATLERFEQWLVTNQPRLFFDLALVRIDQDFPEERTAIQIGDTFGMESHTADLRLYELLGRMGLALWQAFLPLLPVDEPPAPSAQAIYSQALDPAQQQATTFLSPPEWAARTLGRAQQLAPLPSLLAAQAASLPHPQPEPLAHFHLWRQRMEKVLADECLLSPDAPGQPSVVRLLEAKERGSYRILTPVDPEISLRIHDDDIVRGYNVSVAATPDFVREIAAATGATPDSVGVDKLVKEQKEHLGLVPPKLVYDQAAGTPKKIADVAKASDHKTLLVVRLVDYHRNRVRFGPLDFSLGADGLLTCPNGQTSHRAYRSSGGDGWNYRFLANQCADCPLAQKCRGDAVKPDSYRQVFISSYHFQQRAAIAYMHTDEFQADMALRPHIERIIACLVRYNHARTTRKVGLQNADFQVKMAATAYNLKHWLVLILRREKQQKVRSASP